jgi:hypothetical protein
VGKCSQREEVKKFAWISEFNSRVSKKSRQPVSQLKNINENSGDVLEIEQGMLRRWDFFIAISVFAFSEYDQKCDRL